MPTANARKGAETERLVARYFREQGFWMADRRLREGRQDDQGDIDGVPFTTIQVKYAKQLRLPAWVVDTLRQRDQANTPLCLLVVRKPQRLPAAWDAYMPYHQVWPSGPPGGPTESEAWTWVCMDLRLAVAHLHMKIQRQSLSAPSLSTTVRTIEGVAERPYVPFTERADPASPTIWTGASSSASPATPEAPPSI